MVGKAQRISRKRAENLDNDCLSHSKATSQISYCGLASVEQHKVPLATREDAGHPFRMHRNVELYYIRYHTIFLPRRKAFCAIIALISMQKTPFSSHKTAASAASTLVSLAAPWLVPILLPCLLLWCFNGNLQRALPAFITTKRTPIGGSTQGPTKKKNALFRILCEIAAVKSQRSCCCSNVDVWVSHLELWLT